MTDDDLMALVKRVDPRAVRLPLGIKTIAVAIEAAERERCALIARNGCLVPPDGGSPTEDERLLCEEIERRIRDA